MRKFYFLLGVLVLVCSILVGLLIYRAAQTDDLFVEKPSVKGIYYMPK